MKHFEQVFKNANVILSVIHIDSMDQALRNAQIARQQKCDGVFLFNHKMHHSQLLDIHHRAFQEHPDWWIGINCLDLAAWQVFDKISDEVAGVWVDNAQINEEVEEQVGAERIAAARIKSGW